MYDRTDSDPEPLVVVPLRRHHASSAMEANKHIFVNVVKSNLSNKSDLERPNC